MARVIQTAQQKMGRQIPQTDRKNAQKMGTGGNMMMKGSGAPSKIMMPGSGKRDKMGHM